MALSTVELEVPDALAKADTAGVPQSDLLGESSSSTWALRTQPHGVLRLILELDGEIITRATPDIGYLHRGDERSPRT